MTGVEDESDAFVEAVTRLQRGPEPAALIYSTDLPLLRTQPGTTTVNEDIEGDSERGDATVLFARRVATVMARLSELAQPARQQTLTPHAVLQELMDIVRHGLFLALPPSMRHVGDEWHSLSAAFHVYVSARRVPMGAIVDGLCTLAYTSAKLRVELVVAQLRQRLRRELQAQRGTDASALAALLVTQTLLDDFDEIYSNLLLVVPLCHRLARLSSESQGQSVAAMTSDTAAHAPLRGLQPVMVRYYYQLADWVLRVGNAATVPPLSLTRVSHVVCDEKSGTVTAQLHRPSVDVPWGLLFSEQGTLIDIDVAMRVERGANELHQLLLSTGQGAHVVAVNDQPLRLPRGDSRPSSHHSIMNSGTSVRVGDVHRVLQAIATHEATRKTMRLRLASPAFRAAVRQQPQEMAFLVVPQGHEASAGQRVSLLLHRHVPQLPWPFVVHEASLRWQLHATRGLSSAARDFLARYANRLRLWAVNGVELNSAAQAHALAESVETVLLDLVVTERADSSDGGGGVKEKTRREKQSHITSQQQQEEGGRGGQSKTGDTQLQERVSAATPAAVYYSSSSSSLPLLMPSSSALTDTTGASLAQIQPPAVVGKRRSAAQTIKANARAARSGHHVEATNTVDTALREDNEIKRNAHDESRATPAPNATKSTRSKKTATVKTMRVEDDEEKKTGVSAQDVLVTSPAAQHRSGNVVERTRRRVQKLQQSATQRVAEAVQTDTRGKGPSARDNNIIEEVANEDVETDGTSEATRDAAPRVTDNEKHTNITPATITSDAAKTGAASAKAATTRPCELRNDVRICALDEHMMVLERPSTSQAWGLSIEHNKSAAKGAKGSGAAKGSALRLLSLPAPKHHMLEHPFIRTFYFSPSTWYIDRVNGRRNTDAEAMLRYMSSLTRMTLRFIRK